MTGLSDFKLLDEWYKAVIAAGAVLAVPAITVQNGPALTFATGLLLFGIGEFINHPFRTTLVRDGLTTGVISGRKRSSKPFGLALDVVGLGLCIWGLARILML